MNGQLIKWRSACIVTTLICVCLGYVAWIVFSWFYIYLAKVRGLDLKMSAVGRIAWLLVEPDRQLALVEK